MECLLPSRFVELRKFRAVPDHQEVFADASTDQSIIIEINEYQSSVTDEKAAKYFLDDLAEVNEAKTNVLLQTAPLSPKEMPHIPRSNETAMSYAIGEQKVAKHRESVAASNTVHIYLANIRLRKFTADILIMFNVPVAFSDQSSSAGLSLVNSETNKQVIGTLLGSFKINSTDIFQKG